LADEEALRGALHRLNLALVLMAPNDEVEEVCQHILVNVVLLRMCNTILMQHQDAEPRLGVVLRTVEAHLLRREGSVEALVTNVSHAIDGNFGVAFREQYRANSDLINGGALAKVVDEVAHTQQIKRCQTSILHHSITDPISIHLCGSVRQEQREEGRTPAGSSWLP
jgi:hypothetical protein